MNRVRLFSMLHAFALFVASSSGIGHWPGPEPQVYNASACGTVNSAERHILQNIHAHCSVGNFKDNDHCVVVVSLFDSRLARHIPFWLARQAGMQMAASTRNIGRRIALLLAVDGTALAQCRAAAVSRQQNTVCAAVDGGTVAGASLVAQHAVWRALYIAVCAGASTVIFSAAHVFWLGDVVAVIQQRYHDVQNNRQHNMSEQHYRAKKRATGPADAKPTLAFGMRTLLPAQAGGPDPRLWQLASKLDPCTILVYTVGAAAGDVATATQRIVLPALLDVSARLGTYLNNASGHDKHGVRDGAESIVGSIVANEMMQVAWSPRGRRINWVGLDPRSFVPADGLPLQPNGQLGRGQRIETMAVPHLAVELQRQTLGGLYDGVLDPLLKTSILGPLLLPGWADVEIRTQKRARKNSTNGTQGCARHGKCGSKTGTDRMLPACGTSSTSVGSMHTGGAMHRAASVVASSVLELGVGLDPARAVERFCFSYARANSSSLSVPGTIGRRPRERAHRFWQCSDALTELIRETVPSSAFNRWSAWLPVAPHAEAQGDWFLLPLAVTIVEPSEDTSSNLLAMLRSICTHGIAHNSTNVEQRSTLTHASESTGFTQRLHHCSALRQSAIAAVDALLSLDCALVHTVQPAIAAQSLTSVSAAMLTQQLSSFEPWSFPLMHASRRASAAAVATALHKALDTRACGNCSYGEACAWRHDQTKEFAAALAGWANAEPHCVAAQPFVRAIQQTLTKWDVQTIEDIGDPAPMEESSEWSHVRTAALAQWWNCRVETTLAGTQRDRGTNTEPNTPSGFRAQMLAVWDTLRVCAALPSGGPFDLDAAGVRVADGTIFILPKCTVCLKHSDESIRAQSFNDNQSSVTGLIVDTPTCETPGLRVAASLGAFHQAHVRGSIAGSSGNDKLGPFPVLGVHHVRGRPKAPFRRMESRNGNDIDGISVTASNDAVPTLLVVLYPHAYPNFGHWILDMLLPLSTELPLVAAAALRLAEEAETQRARLAMAIALPHRAVTRKQLSHWELLEALAADALLRQQHARQQNQPKLTVDVVVTTLDDAQHTLGTLCVEQVALYSTHDHYDTCCTQLGGKPPLGHRAAMREFLLRELGETLRRSAYRKRRPLPFFQRPPPMPLTMRRLVLIVERPDRRRILNAQALLHACRGVVAATATITAQRMSTDASRLERQPRPELYELACESINFERLRLTQIAAMLRHTVVLTGVHGAGLANAPLLEPAARWLPAVIEIVPYRLEECAWALENISELVKGLGLRYESLLVSSFPGVLERSLRRMDKGAPALADDNGGFTVMHATPTLSRPPRDVLSDKRPFSCTVGSGGELDVALAFRDQDTAVDVEAFSRVLARMLAAD